MTKDERWMDQALALACRSNGRTHPNPMVGAVVVREGRVVGEGFHRRAGEAHAEVIALRQAGSRARGATLYVTLEPCGHYGKTPPCAEAILASGVRRVVVPIVDPNPIVRGQGLARLRRAGVRVDVGIRREEARVVNAPFFKAMETGIPYVTVKIAQTLDGKIATKTGRSRWISSPEARAFAQRLRTQVDAIVAGASTIVKDNPLLSARDPRTDRVLPELQPLKVILDPRGRSPRSARIFSKASPGKVLWVTRRRFRSPTPDPQPPTPSIETLWVGGNGRIPLRRLLAELCKRGVVHLLVEGGGETVAGFLEAGLVDRLYVLIAPKIIGGRRAPTWVEGEGIAEIEKALPIRWVSVRPLGPDLLVEAIPQGSL